MPLCKKISGVQAGQLNRYLGGLARYSRFPIPYFLYIDIKCSVNIRRTPGEHSPNIQQRLWLKK
ncbi:MULTISPECIES: hypothetical protein [unclassified Moorena]|uniref:hypothetical protein n=1 Tax=unclassified Moorena TaxID=2683338 RepID=UPI0013C1E8BE|nr:MULTISPECIES: hypothetical protein [unclassified Moorena]NEO08761.1 hypothetical protein [Moorena sp. SIO3I8]NEP23049.1 hypothetical protein [Moorena sp. SIO3I6]